MTFKEYLQHESKDMNLEELRAFKAKGKVIVTPADTESHWDNSTGKGCVLLINKEYMEYTISPNNELWTVIGCKESRFVWFADTLISNTDDNRP